MKQINYDIVDYSATWFLLASHGPNDPKRRIPRPPGLISSLSTTLTAALATGRRKGSRPTRT